MEAQVMGEIYCTCYYFPKDAEYEHLIGNIIVQNIPREGECVWFSEKRLGATAWKVESVAHWVGDGEAKMPYQSVCLYCVPVRPNELVLPVEE
jgi:hypothetical protein